ncbi:hypothetical protein TNCV_886941 [Trichonephila clavipes]|uniref:Uncharacterized protein n=1 Tax=Trichonephila clavipes TaxID=2585209 RepID=A0A8X6R7U6_TRICX|nr:hypothetical protein TNCV_886941 [Trichonephila clavipes]
MDSVDRSNVVCEEPKHGHSKRPWPKDMNITLETQIERDTQNKNSASNSLLMKCSNVYSKETPREKSIPGRSLSNEENEIKCNPNDKKTNKSCSVD